MLIVVVDDGQLRRFYKMSQQGFENLIDKAENFGLEIDAMPESEIPLADETEILNDFGSLGL